MKNFLPKSALKQLSTYIAVIVIFVHNVVLDKNMECTCEDVKLDCTSYMVGPFLMIIVLQLWTDKTFHRTCKYKCKFCYFLLYRLIKAFFIGLLWVVSVFIEGDWYVCCWNNGTEGQKHLACKDEKNLTAKERIDIIKLKNHSKIIGIYTLLAIITAAATMSSWIRSCCKDSSCCNKKLQFSKVIMDEEENVLKEILTTAAKNQLTDKVNEKLGTTQWEGCFDVAKELINNPNPTRAAPPAAAGQHQADGIELPEINAQGPVIPPEPVRPEDLPLLPGNPGSSDEQ